MIFGERLYCFHNSSWEKESFKSLKLMPGNNASGRLVELNGFFCFVILIYIIKSIILCDLLVVFCASISCKVKVHSQILSWWNKKNQTAYQWIKLFCWQKSEAKLRGKWTPFLYVLCTKYPHPYYICIKCNEYVGIQWARREIKCEHTFGLWEVRSAVIRF